jgi:2EXR family
MIHSKPHIHSITKDSLRRRRAGPRISVTSTSTEDDGFPFFAKLPLELQLRIWKMTTEEHRLVLIRIAKDEEGCSSFYSPTPIPAALHVCSESRQVAQKTYKLCFGSRTDDLKPMIYFNFDQDTLYIRGDTSKGPSSFQSHASVFGMGIKEEGRNQIKSLAVDMNTACPRAVFRNVNIQQWKGLKDVRLCVEEPRLDLESNLEFRDLEEKEHWAFVNDYRRTTSAWLVPKTLHPSVAINKIEDEHMNTYAQLKEILKTGGGRGFSLSIVVSS